MGEVIDIEFHQCSLENVTTGQVLRYSVRLLGNPAFAVRTGNVSLKSCCVALLKTKIYMPEPSKIMIQP